jgi:SEC-C motif-containing protein
MVLGLNDYVFRTWHPRTRPADLAIEPMPFTRLVIVDAPDADEVRGEVAFEAYSQGGVMTERSRFEKRAGRWFYVDGDVGGRPRGPS